MRIGDIAANESTSTAVPWYQQVINSLTQVAQGVITIKQQDKLNSINLTRAQQGLPPLDSSQYQTGLNLGLGSSTQNTLLTVAAIGGGIWLLTSVIGASSRRRR